MIKTIPMEIPQDQNRKLGFGYTVPNMIEPQPINCVLPPEQDLGALYIGNFECAMSIQLLKKHRIRAVLTASIETGLKYAQEVVHFHEYFQAHDNDEYDITQHFQKSFEFIDRHRKYTSVLVHCFAGVSRSATLVVAYLMRKFGWNLEQALWFLKSQRRWVNPNPGFIKQLTSYETSLFGSLSKETHIFLMQNDHIFNPKGNGQQTKQLTHNSSTPQLVKQPGVGKQPVGQHPVQQPQMQPQSMQMPPNQAPNANPIQPQQQQPQTENTVSLSPQAYQIYISLPPNQQQQFLQQQMMVNQVPIGNQGVSYPQEVLYQQPGPNVNLGSSQFINTMQSPNGIAPPQQSQQQQAQIVYVNEQGMVTNNPLGVNSNYLNMQQPQVQGQQQAPPQYYNQPTQQYYIVE